MRLRYRIQIFFFILIGLISINHNLKVYGMEIPLLSSASLNAIRPFGGVNTVYNFLSGGIFTHNNVPFILMFLVFFLAIAFGPLLCGWICPLGSFQEWIGKIGKKIFTNRYNHFIPYTIDRILRYGRYVVLLWVIYMIAVTGRLVTTSFDPYNALFNFWTGEVAIGALTILGVTILLSAIMERPWCKYACPLGALLGLTNLFRFFKLKRMPDSCIACDVCDKACPMNIKVSTGTVVNNHQCISCYECTSENVCPISDTVKIAPKKSGMVIKNTIVAVTAFVVILGGIGLTIPFNISKKTSSKMPAKFTQDNNIGYYDPESIKGSATLGQTSQQFQIPIEDLAQAFGIPLDLAESFRHSIIEEVYEDILGTMEIEVGNGSVKLFVALYTGLPYEVTEPTYLLKPGVEILRAKATLTDEQLNYIQQHLVDPSATEVEKYFSQYTPQLSDVDQEITGQTTFGDLLSWGIREETIEQIIDDSSYGSTMSVKDYCDRNGLSFGRIKEMINAEL